MWSPVAADCLQPCCCSETDYLQVGKMGDKSQATELKGKTCQLWFVPVQTILTGGEKSSKAGKPVESVVVGGKFMSKPSGSSIDVRNRT